MSTIEYSAPVLMDTVSHPKLGLYFDIFCVTKTVSSEDFTDVKKLYNFSMRRTPFDSDGNPRVNEDNGENIFTFKFFAKHIGVMKDMLDEVYSRIKRFELEDKFGKDGGIE